MTERRAGRYGWHGADCGNVGARRIVLDERGKRVEVYVCTGCRRVIRGRVLFGGVGHLGASTVWLAQLLGAEVGDLVVGQERRIA